MGKPATLLERLCGHALSFGANRIEVESKDGRDIVFARKGGERIRIFQPTRADSEELRQNLYAAARMPVLAMLHGNRSLLKVRILDSAGEDAFKVTIEPAPSLDSSALASFTARQGQYLAFIYYYMKLHRVPPAESDMQRYFGVSGPSVHQMVVTLELNGFIERVPGQGRSIRLLVPPEALPKLL